MLEAGEKLASQQGASSTAVLLGHNVKSFAEELATRASKSSLLRMRSSSILIPVFTKKSSPLSSRNINPPHLDRTHAFGMDLAPSLSVEMGFPWLRIASASRSKKIV